MGVVGRLKKGDFAISGDVNERLPSITDKLVAHFPFDGSTDRLSRSVSKANVFYQGKDNLTYPLYNWLINNGATVTQGDFSALDAATALQYDLIVIDWRVWGLPAGYDTKIKSIVDAGVSIFACGNDTRNNIFVLSSDTSIAPAAHGIQVVDTTNVDVPQFEYYSTYTDLIGGITALQNGAVPYYRRMDYPNIITGYIYDSPISGAAFYFDQEGDLVNDLHYAGIHYVLGKSKGGKFNLSTTNTTLTNNGMAIDDATTNYITNPLDPSTWSSNKNTDFGFVSETVIDTEFGKAMRRTTNGTDYQGCLVMIPHTFPQTVVAGEKYVFSIYARSLTGKSAMNLNFEGLNASGVRVDVTKQYNITSSDWTKCELVCDPASVGMTKLTYNYFKVYTQSQDGKNQTLDIVMPQFEKKTYSTSFVKGSRADSDMSLTSNLSAPFTIHFEYTPTTPNNNNERAVTVLCGNNSANDLLVWKRVDEDYYRIRLNSTSDFTVSNTIMKQGVKTKITIVCSSTTSASVYINGVLLGTRTLSSMPTFSTLSFRMFNSDMTGNMNNGIYHSLSIYGKALSASEVGTLAGNRLVLDKYGNMKNTRLVERQVLQDGVAYFPFGSDTNEYYGQFTPSEVSSNVTFDEGGYWGGLGTNNLVVNPQFELNIGRGGIASWVRGADLNLISGTAGRSGYCARISSTVGGYTGTNGMSTTDILTANKVYTLSYWVKRVTGNGKLGVAITGLDNNIASYTPTTNDKWEKVVKTFTTTDTSAASILFYADTAYDVFDIDDVQVEQRDFNTPFMNGVSGVTSLEFNLNRDWAFDWNGNWSIVYFKKPMTTHSNDKLGYSIESIGANSNTVGGGFRWWGKNLNTNQVGISGQMINIDPNQYFGQWHMVSIVKNGTQVTFKFHNCGGVALATAGWTIGTVASNYFVNQYGYDLKLGGWDNGNNSGAYFRDLIIAKRAFSDTELKMFADNQLKSKNGSTYIQGLFKEGITIN